MLSNKREAAEGRSRVFFQFNALYVWECRLLGAQRGTIAQRIAVGNTGPSHSGAGQKVKGLQLVAESYFSTILQ